jgi:hypothetical protein
LRNAWSDARDALSRPISILVFIKDKYGGMACDRGDGSFRIATRYPINIWLYPVIH